MDLNKIEQAAALLWDAEEKRETCAPVRDIIGASDVDAAYKIQEINNQRKINQGRRVVGSKIGLTSFSVQQQLGVDQPDYGLLFQDTEVENNGSISVKQLMQPKVEAEIAFIMKKDLDIENLSVKAVADAVDYAVAAIEIVGSRVEGWNIRITDTVADNASASHFVLGDKKVALHEVDLEHCKMSMTQNGEVASEGTGKACMDSPLNAALWLAQTMQQLGSPVKAGDIVLTGALGPMVNVEANQAFVASIDGLGNVGVSFTE